MDMSKATKFATRDSCTAALRKLGVTKQDYDDFISKHPNGQYYVDIDGAKVFVAKQAPVGKLMLDGVSGKMKVVKPAAKPEAKADAPAKKEPKPAKTDGKQTVSGRIRALILAGKSNQEVYDLGIKEGFLKETQKTYASWYRCELRRKGENV